MKDMAKDQFELLQLQVKACHSNESCLSWLVDDKQIRTFVGAPFDKLVQKWRIDINAKPLGSEAELRVKRISVFHKNQYDSLPISSCFKDNTIAGSLFQQSHCAMHALNERVVCLKTLYKRWNELALVQGRGRVKEGGEGGGGRGGGS